MEIDQAHPIGVAKRRRFTQSERAEHLSAWKRSGQSARVYAQAHGLSAGNLYAWSRKSDGSPDAGPRPFVPVRISGGLPLAGATPRVILKSAGLECVIEGAADAEAFAALASALKREVFDV